MRLRPIRTFYSLSVTVRACLASNPIKEQRRAADPRPPRVQPPRKTRWVTPIYPPDAAAAGIKGVVILEVTIDRDGTVHEAKVLRSIPLLDQAALDAVKEWEFSPGLVNGVPIPFTLAVVVPFGQ